MSYENEARVPAGQPGGGQWTAGDIHLVIQKAGFRSHVEENGQIWVETSNPKTGSVVSNRVREATPQGVADAIQRTRTEIGQRDVAATHRIKSGII